MSGAASRAVSAEPQRIDAHDLEVNFTCRACVRLVSGARRYRKIGEIHSFLKGIENVVAGRAAAFHTGIKRVSSSPFANGWSCGYG